MKTPSATVKDIGDAEARITIEKATIVNMECKVTDAILEETVKVNGAFDVPSTAYSNIPTSKLFSLEERTIIGEGTQSSLRRPSF